MLNRVMLIGHLGGDPDIRTTQSGAKVASVSLATSERWRDKATGERREKTEWHRLVIWNEALVKIAEQYLRKGARVYIEGQLATRKWTDKEGRERYTTEIVLNGFSARIVMLDRADRAPAPQSPDDYGTPSGTDAAAPSPAQDMNDEIPF